MRVEIYGFPPNIPEGVDKLTMLIGKPIHDVQDNSFVITIVGGEEKELAIMWKAGIPAIHVKPGDIMTIKRNDNHRGGFH